jgi:hypothetical protein
VYAGATAHWYRGLQLISISISTGKLPVQVDRGISKFQGTGHSTHSATVELAPPPRVPPKKATTNENTSQGDGLQSQVESKKVWVPPLPPKPKN